MMISKARKKFLKKRVHHWELQDRYTSPLYRLTVFNSGRNRLRYTSDTEPEFQIFDQIRRLGFIKGFFKARELVRKRKDLAFWYEKIIKI